jgi:starvation-inducible outer membrane lipoprotein
MKKSYLVLFTISFLLMGCTLPWAKVENNKEEIIDDETVVAKDEGTGEMKKEKTNLETQ